MSTATIPPRAPERTVWLLRRDGGAELRLDVLEGVVDYCELREPRVVALPWQVAQGILRDAGYTWRHRDWGGRRGPA